MVPWVAEAASSADVANGGPPVADRALAETSMLLGTGREHPGTASDRDGHQRALNWLQNSLP